MSNQSIGYRPSSNGLHGLSQPGNIVRQAGNWKQRRDKRALEIAADKCVPEQAKWNNRLEEIIEEKLKKGSEGGSLVSDSSQKCQVQKSISVHSKRGRRNATDFLTGQELLSVALETVGRAERLLEHTDGEGGQQGQSSAARAPDPRDFGGDEDEGEDEGGKDVDASTPLLLPLGIKLGGKWNAVKKMAKVGRDDKRDSLGVEFISHLNENTSLAEAAKRRQEALDRGRSKSVDPNMLPSMFESSEQLGFSGVYRLSSLRRTIEAEHRSVIERNPVAFREEAGLMEEAEYRSRAEVARIRFESMKKSMHNEGAVVSRRKYLSHHRPCS